LPVGLIFANGKSRRIGARRQPCSAQAGERIKQDDVRKGAAMGSTAIIQVVAGVLFVVVLIVLIQRRRTRTK
jgi:hypothetical protein